MAKATIRYCPEHGPFVGLRWNGHRIHCKLDATTKTAYETAAKSAVAHPKVRSISAGPKISGKVGETLESLSSEMKTLNLRINGLKIEVEDREKEIFQLTQLRSKIKETIHDLLGEMNA